MEEKTTTLTNMRQVLNYLSVLNRCFTTNTMLTITQLYEKQLPEATKLLCGLPPDNKYSKMTYFVNAQIPGPKSP